MEVCQNILVPALNAGTQKNRPYQSDIYTVLLLSLQYTQKFEYAIDILWSILFYFNIYSNRATIVKSYIIANYIIPFQFI